MTEKELIKQLKTLKEIKPRKEWALLLKLEILNAQYAEQKITAKPAQKIGNLDFGFWNLFRISDLGFRVFSRRLAYAFATLCFFVVGVFGFAQYTMPGDLLFPVKKITEQTQTPLQVAYNRSEDLVQIIKENKIQNLDSAILEFKTSVTDAAKTITQDLVKNNDKESIKVVMAEVKKIQDNQEQMKTLGVNIGDAKELDDVLALIVQEQIDFLNESTLTEKQQEALKGITELYEQEKYSDALEKILLISN